MFCSGGGFFGFSKYVKKQKDLYTFFASFHEKFLAEALFLILASERICELSCKVFHVINKGDELAEATNKVNLWSEANSQSVCKAVGRA